MSEDPGSKAEGRRKRRGGLRVPSDTVPRKEVSVEEDPGNFADAVSDSFGAGNGVVEESIDQDEIATVVAEADDAENAPTIAMDAVAMPEQSDSPTLVEMPAQSILKAEQEHESEEKAEDANETEAVSEEISVLDSGDVRAISEDETETPNRGIPAKTLASDPGADETIVSSDSVDIPFEDSDENTLTSEIPTSTEDITGEIEAADSLTPAPEAPDLTPQAPSVPDLPPVEPGAGKKKPRFTRAMTMALNESDLEEVRAEVAAISAGRAATGTETKEVQADADADADADVDVDVDADADAEPTPKPVQQEASASEATPEPSKPQPPATPIQAKTTVKTASTPPKPAPKSSGKEKPRRGKPWFEEIFDENYLRTLPFLTPQATKFEANFVMESLGVEAGTQVLDLGCGYGRHAMELAARGYHVVGLDSSMPLLLRGAEEAQRRNLNINFVHGDMRDMEYESQFDGAYCLFSTFGYFDDESNKKTARNICKSLKPGARFVVEVLNRDYLVADLPSRVWWEGDGCVVLEEVEFNYFSSRIVSNRSVVFDDGRQLEQEISLRSFSLHELGKFLHSVGFRVLEISGSMSTRGRFFGAHSRDIVVVAEKRPDESSSSSDS